MTNQMTTSDPRGAQLAQLNQTLKAQQAAITKLTQNDQRTEELISSAMLAVAEQPKLQRCDPRSILRAVMQAAIWGLRVNHAGEAYLVPYGDQCTMMPGYRGLERVAQRAGYQLVTATIHEEEAKLMKMSRVPMHLEIPAMPYKAVSDRGAFMGTVCAAFMGGRLYDFEWTSAEDIDRAKQSTDAWKKWPEMMNRKLAISRLCKRLPDNAVRDLVELDEKAERGILYDLKLDTPADINVPTQSLAQLPEGVLTMDLGVVSETAPQEEEHPLDQDPDPAPAKPKKTDKRTPAGVE